MAPLVDAWLRRTKLKLRLLDYGSGRGADADWYAQRWAGRVEVERFDPHYAPTPPRGSFDVITCTFVLNVLPASERLLVLPEASRFLRQRGLMVVAARSVEGIRSEAKMRGWQPVQGGGYMPTSRTFQEGLSVDDLVLCARVAGLVVAELDPEVEASFTYKKRDTSAEVFSWP